MKRLSVMLGRMSVVFLFASLAVCVTVSLESFLSLFSVGSCSFSVSKGMAPPVEPTGARPKRSRTKAFQEGDNTQTTSATRRARIGNDISSTTYTPFVARTARSGRSRAPSPVREHANIKSAFDTWT